MVSCKKHRTELHLAFRKITHVTHTHTPQNKPSEGTAEAARGCKTRFEGWKVAEDAGTLETFQWLQTFVKTFNEDELETRLFPSPCLPSGACSGIKKQIMDVFS
uniref:Uncharacterized protein n=1 Tax=Micrurus spixii TaxID=129469 RepID=A0A2D4MK62_9SAUR